METISNTSQNQMVKDLAKALRKILLLTSGVIHCFSDENHSKPTSVKICIPMF